MRPNFWRLTLRCRRDGPDGPQPEYVNLFLNMLLGAALLCGFVGPANGQELVFSPAADARRILSTKDAFVERLSPFDRSSRMKTDRAIAEGEFLEFVASAALEWEPREKDAIDSAFREIRPAVARLLRPIPGRINVIKTSGREEGNVPYTRGNTIIFPTRALASRCATSSLASTGWARRVMGS